MKVIELKFQSEWIRIEFDLKTGAGRIESNLKTGLPEDHDYDSAIDGMESLILSHACAGVDVSDPKYVKGIEETILSIAENT